LLVGLLLVLAGANYAVANVIQLATLFAVPVGVVSITAIAIGTSLPELSVAMKALKEGRAEFAIGSIFGSNSFNILVVVGIPGLFTPLAIGPEVMTLGLPILIAASAIFFVNGLAKQIMRWEGLMLLIFFGFFVIKLLAYCASCVTG
jgi:cation:H+ antiporter